MTATAPVQTIRFLASRGPDAGYIDNELNRSSEKPVYFGGYAALDDGTSQYIEYRAQIVSGDRVINAPGVFLLWLEIENFEATEMMYDANKHVGHLRLQRKH